MAIFIVTRITDSLEHYEESYEKSLQFYSIKIITMQKLCFLKMILKHSENILIALQYIKKTPLTLWTISRVIWIDQDQ